MADNIQADSFTADTVEVNPINADQPLRPNSRNTDLLHSYNTSDESASNDTSSPLTPTVNQTDTAAAAEDIIDEHDTHSSGDEQEMMVQCVHHCRTRPHSIKCQTNPAIFDSLKGQCLSSNDEEDKSIGEDALGVDTRATDAKSLI